MSLAALAAPTDTLVAPAPSAGANFGGTGLSLAALDDMPTRDREAVAVATLKLAYEQREELLAQIKELELYLIDAMFRRGADVIVTDDLELRRKPKVRWQYDFEGLSQLQAYLTPEEYEEAVHEVREMRANKTVLNKLAKRGGEVRELIESHTMQTIIGTDLEVKSRKR